MAVHSHKNRREQAQQVGTLYAPRFFHSESEFVDALRAGRADAQTELFRRHHNRVAAVLHRVLGKDDDLQDLVQEVFVRAMTGADGFRGTGDALESWLIRIAVFTARGLIRRRRLWRRFFSASEAVTDVVPATVATVEQLEAVRRTYQVFDKLPTTERIALALSLIDEMPLPQIAEACGVSHSTIKRRLRKARQRFDTLVTLDPALRDLHAGGDS